MMQKKLVICADFFGISGGAEQTLEVLVSGVLKEKRLANSDVEYILTSELTVEKLNAFKNSIWIFGNYFNLIHSPLRLQIIQQKIKFYVVEFDYKICPTRNFELYMFQNRRQYEYEQHAEKVDLFLSSAQKVFFMSSRQMQRHLDFCKFLKPSKCVLSGSCFNEEALSLLENYRKSPKQDICAVYGQFTWQKGGANAIFWCEQNNKKYKSLFGLDYKDFLFELSTSSTFVFLPNGADTSPRAVIEAQLMGVEVIISELVESFDEDWFMEKDLEKKKAYLRSLPQKFASEIDL